VAEQTVEGVRNAEDGTVFGCEKPGQSVDAAVDAAMREEARWEALFGFRRAARFFGVQRAVRKS
jgi:hypothetical protein